MSIPRPCLEEEEVLDYVEGTSSSERAALEHHLDACDECRAVVTSIAEYEPTPSHGVDVIDSGARTRRYRVRAWPISANDEEKARRRS